MDPWSARRTAPGAPSIIWCMPFLHFLRLRLPVIILGLCSECAYLLYFVRQFPLLTYYQRDIDMGGITGHSHAGFFAFVGIFTALFLVVAVTWWLLQDAEDSGTLWLVLGFGAVFAVTMVFVYPVTAIDIFSYIDQSRIMLHYHQNPIFTTPAQYGQDPLMGLSDGWSGAGAPYGPLGLVIDAIPMLFVGGNLLANLILLKLMFSAMALGSAGAVYQLLRRVSPRHAITGALLVAWNPLVLFEVSANGHNDMAMMLLAVLGLLSVVNSELTVGPLLLVASALIKYATVILLPIALLYGLARQPTWRARALYLWITTVSMLLLVVLAYWRFWEGVVTLTHLLYQTQRFLVSFSSVVVQLFPGTISLDGATLLGRAFFAVVYLYALQLSIRGGVALLQACFLAMFAFVGLGVTNFESWYGAWPVLLGAAVPRLPERAATLLFAWGATLGAAFFGYVWVWLNLSQDGFVLANKLSYLLAFLPAALAILLLRRWPVADSTGSSSGSS